MKPAEALRPFSTVAPVAASIAGAVVVAVLGVSAVLPRPTVAGLLGLVVVAVCLAGLYRATVAATFSPVAVTFFSFVAVWVGFAPLLQIRDRRLPWPDLPLDQHYVTAQVILLMAVAAFWAGYRRRRPAMTAGRRPPAMTAGRPPAVATGPRRFRLDVTIEKAVVVTGLAAVLALVCLPRTGGLAVRFMSRDDLQEAIARAGLRGGRDLALMGLLSTLPAAVSFVALVLCLLCWRAHNYAGRTARGVLVAATAAALCLNAVYNNPLSANRFTFFTVMLASALVVLRFSGQWWRTAFSAGMLSGLAVVYPLANAFRNERSQTDLRLGTQAYYTYDFDGFQQTVNAVHFVHVHGHTWGHHIVSALLFWVPRSLWEGKAIPAGNAVADSRGYEFQNLALPFWAEVFVESGLVGVVVLFYFYGKVARRLDGWVGGRATALTTAVALLFAACQIGLLRGPLGAQIPFVGAAFVVLVAATAGCNIGARLRSRGSNAGARLRSRGVGASDATPSLVAPVASLRCSSVQAPPAPTRPPAGPNAGTDELDRPRSSVQATPATTRTRDELDRPRSSVQAMPAPTRAPAGPAAGGGEKP